MRTLKNRAHGTASRSGSAPATPYPATPAVGAGAGALPEIRTPDDATSLQAQAGNRATVQRIRDGAVVQRELTIGQAATIAARLHDAMEGWGTDEDAIYGALTSRTPDDIEEIKDAYFIAYDTTLLADLRDEMSGDELARAERLLQGTAAPGARATAAETAAATRATARAIAEQLRDAMAGLGTEEDQIYNALEGRTQGEIGAIRTEYLALTGRRLEEDLIDDLSGDELRRALDLLGIRDTATFTNEIEQNMTEQATTVVRGRFNWTLTGDKLEVDVPAHFMPAEGVAFPLGTWQGQIDGVWNQFAIRSTDGERTVPVEMKLRNDSNDPRLITVVENSTPGSYGPPDRANAGKWYPVMPADTAPHEFGHLLGLPDEYQRTHGDFTKITGEDRVGPSNESGRTSEEIAADLHARLTEEDVSLRATHATTLLTEVGLIASGRPQQGTFAQDVMRAYDDAYSPDLLPALAELPRAGRWTLQTVFSFASGTIMGNPDQVGVQPHEHPVMPRHMREFRDIVARSIPEKTWEVGSR
jgi:hypothetical protein